jgi:hypothetical protein
MLIIDQLLLLLLPSPLLLPLLLPGMFAGVGLVFPTQLGRLEANYCWVLTSQEHDRLRRGFSFGFAANMGL